MSATTTPFSIDIPNFGTVPVQVTHDPNPGNATDVTHCPPPHNPDPVGQFLGRDIARVNNTTGKIPQYAVRRQKILTLTADQLDQLTSGKLLIGTATGTGKHQLLLEELKSITSDPTRRIIRSDCPDPVENGDVTYTVLLDWTENTSAPFPTLLLRNANSGELVEIDQTDNFLLSGYEGGDGPNNPPARPPISASGPLNTQVSDFRPASRHDLDHYQAVDAADPQAKNPAVAVMDTGLKFNLLNRTEEDQWEKPYLYRDALGQYRPFVLAYQHPTGTDCTDLLTKNAIGYCALRTYREPSFVAGLQSLTTDEPATYTDADVANSPYDDNQLFTNAANTTLRDARHGTSVTAIIQQNGDDAPVLPVKVFDNVGFGTLFDVLNGFNYVLHRCQSANIRVVNASWIFLRDEPLLKKKIKQLLDAGVFVVAAAGNAGQTDNQNLDLSPVYPACYSQELPNVITVTSVRKTYLPPHFLSPRGDSVVGNLLTRAIQGLGLFNVLAGADEVAGAILPTAGYTAVENYSTTYVNVGVVSTFGHFRSPFWSSQPVRGSSFASAFVSGFVIRQFNSRPDLLPTERPVSSAIMANLRQELLKSMNTNTDDKLKTNYVAGGYFLTGYSVD